MRTLPVFLLLTACGNTTSPTYYADVAPIFDTHCISCHTDDSIGPMPLTSYEEVTPWASGALAAIEDGVMPPWAITADGSCGDWQDTNVVSAEEIATLTAWIAADMPEGNAADAVEVQTIPREPLQDVIEIRTPEYQPEIIGGSLAASDDYRCFVVDPGHTTDTFITGYDVLPGDPELIHHVLVYTVDPTANARNGETNAVQMANEEAADGRDGWECFAEAGNQVRIKSAPVNWAPGGSPLNFPDGTGVRLAAGDQLVIQVHYNMAEITDQSDQTTVQLEVADTVQNEAWFSLQDDFISTLYSGSPDTIPAGQAAARIDWSVPAENVLFEGGSSFETASTLKVWGVLPHMHTRGTQLFFSIVRANGDSECAAQVTDWDFNWQTFYWRTTPIELFDGDRLDVTCIYDTTGDSAPVGPGWGTANEMCLVGMYATAE